MELKAWQQSDPTSRRERVYFYLQDGLLHQHRQPEGSAGLANSCEQLVQPKECQLVVLHHSHDMPIVRHLGITKSKDCILQCYYWPGIFPEVARHCKSCEICQKSPPQRPTQAERMAMLLVSQPFHRLTTDQHHGPLPRTKRGN